MGNCISSQKKQFSKDDVMDQSVCVVQNDTPYEERTYQERLDSEARQRIRALNRYGN